MNTLLKWLCTAAILLCLGCPDPFSQQREDPPGSPSTTTGRADGLKVSWNDPSPDDGDDTTVHVFAVSYSIKRDGTVAGTTTETSWIDPTAEPATEYRYAVSATYSDGGVTAYSGSTKGWYVPAKNLSFGTGPGLTSQPGSSVTPDGWYATFVVKGWKYHFDIVGSAITDLWICDDKKPWVQTSLGTNTAFVWTADRTGNVWVKTGPARSLQAWYE